ncbi:MAG TPA: rhodanese-like domain-containing protein [Acidimicrobiia bacterium]|nr:rhodanese-like domain-containing protein [Acidimicrobiia bacterium]
MTATIDRATVITTYDLRRRLGDTDLTLVDVRPLAAYNGWKLRGEARGGHIPGAVAFPARWLTLVDEEGLDQVLADKGIAVGKTIVVYGDTPGQGGDLKAKLGELGIHEVLEYGAGFEEWAGDFSLPLERLPNYDKLVYPEWVRQLLDGATPEGYQGTRSVVFHVNFGVPEEYADGHIPGAFYLDTNWLESSVDWNRRSPEEIEAALLSLGITRDTTVVLYGRDTVGNPNEKWPGRRAGQIAATRAAAILRYAGVDDVRLLDGGYDWWVTAGYDLETEIRTPSPAATFGVSIPQRPEVIIDIAEAKAILADQEGAALVSVRTWREHTGKTSGYNYIQAKGRIVGDVWGNCGTDAYHMQHYRNVDNTMRAYPEIASNWAEAGITPDKWVAFYCGTGWRASETWFYAYLMGWPRIAVYDGGWFEWSQDPVNNPIEPWPIELAYPA